MNVILVVAEDRAICESLRAALPDSDLALVEHTLEDALRRLITVNVDAIIIDDTPQLGRRALVRLQEASPGTPCLVLASRGNAETRAGFTLAGARACIAKPFSCEDLRAALETMMQPQRREPQSGPGAGVHSPAPSVLSRHQTALKWLSRVSGHIENQARLGESLVEAMTDTFDAARCAVLAEEEGGVRVMASSGLPVAIATSVRLAFSTGVMRFFEENACLIDRDAPRTPSAAVKEMQLLGARLGVPVICAGRVRGAILVGEKAAGGDYDADERDLLTAVARAASIAFENASLYRNLAHQQSRLDTVMGNITAGVVVVTADKTVSLMNQSAERILQLRSLDVLGRSVQQLGSGLANVVLRTLEDRAPRLRQEVRDPAIGATLGVSATPLGDEGVVAIFSKIPQETESTEDIAYSPFWEYLASRVAQEIKNPLVAINTFAQMLPRKYDSEEFRESFGDVVQKEVARINSVVETLFEFARHPRLVLQRTSLNDTVNSVLRSFDSELQQRQIQVETDWDPSHPAAEIDPIYFSQALHNVLQNCIEALPKGGRIFVRTSKFEDRCEVDVSDTGPGVSEQDAPHVFMPFFSTKETGMGLGLTVASRIMQQHEGSLELKIDADRGSVFKFRVPVPKGKNGNASGD